MPINITDEFVRNLMEQNAALMEQVAELTLTSHVFPTQIDKQVPRCSKQQSTCFML